MSIFVKKRKLDYFQYSRRLNFDFFFLQVTLEEGDESGEGVEGEQTAISGEEGGGVSEETAGDAGM